MQETQVASKLETISITMIDQHGQSHEIDASPGETLMEVAKANDIAGIDADCGGCCACGTCRMDISPTLQQLLPPALDDELAVIAFVGDDSGTQRLGCQIEITPEFHLAKIKVAT
ncbi:MAG: 2Fe-2S iron-sulfur cluster-binding protein [Oceanococcus sp.]